MKKLVLMVFLFGCLCSCGKSLREKELELKERELELKEKELQNSEQNNELQNFEDSFESLLLLSSNEQELLLGGFNSFSVILTNNYKYDVKVEVLIQYITLSEQVFETETLFFDVPAKQSQILNTNGCTRGVRINKHLVFVECPAIGAKIMAGHN